MRNDFLGLDDTRHDWCGWCDWREL